jgi:hypothetical protein
VDEWPSAGTGVTSTHHVMVRASHLASCSFVLTFVVLVASACSSSGDATDSGDSGSAQGGPIQCGIALVGPQWLQNCQDWTDQYCCGQQKACAADAACAKLVACLNACPSPRQNACINACTPDGGSAVNLLDGIETCTVDTPPTGGPQIPDPCEWPTGG